MYGLIRVVARSVLRENEEVSWPADLYLEGSDQHRGWFQSSLDKYDFLRICSIQKNFDPWFCG